MTQKTVIFDFDGVIHSYTSGWKGIDVITDEPNPDVVKAIEELRAEGYQIAVVSTRCAEPRGIAAIHNYLNKHDIKVDLITIHKPPAIVSIDDRAICYVPGLPIVEAVKNFHPWRPQCAEQAPADTMDIEILAKALHEAGRAAVEAGNTVAAEKFGEQTRKFIEWDEMTEVAREGRRIQARYLLERYTIEPRLHGTRE